MKRILTVAALALGLVSCATMKPEECLQAQWQQKGYSDALAGSTVLLTEHAKACAKVAVVPDKAEYMKGYNEGAVRFCTYDNGLEWGRSGRYASDICSKPALSQAFNEGYERGRKIYARQQQISEKESEIRRINDKLADIKSRKIASNVDEVDLLHREKELLNREIQILRDELARL